MIPKLASATDIVFSGVDKSFAMSVSVRVTVKKSNASQVQAARLTAKKAQFLAESMRRSVIGFSSVPFFGGLSVVIGLYMIEFVVGGGLCVGVFARSSGGKAVRSLYTFSPVEPNSMPSINRKPYETWRGSSVSHRFI